MHKPLSTAEANRRREDADYVRERQTLGNEIRRLARRLGCFSAPMFHDTLADLRQKRNRLRRACRTAGLPTD
jgi:hypothetical protein